MKRKYAAMVLGLTLALTSMNVAYAATDTTTATEAAEDTTDTEDAATTDETASDEVYGEVTEVSEDSITINVGTLKETQAPGEGQKPEDNKTNADAKDEKTDDNKDDADAKDEKADDSKDDADAKDEKADDSKDDADAGDEKTSDDKGEAPAEGEAPSMLDLTGDSQTITVSDSTTYEKEAAPEKPEETPAAGAKDEKADDSKDGADAKAEKKDDSKDESADAQIPEMKTESITFSGIKVGDVIKVTLDADGNASVVVVMNSGAPEKSEDAKDDSEDSDTEKDSADTSEDSTATTDSAEESK